MLKSIINGGCTLRIAVGFLILACFVFSASAATLTVNASGGADYTRIQDAIDNARDGDTILVDSGTYYENVDVHKQLILKGIDTGGGKPVVDSGGFNLRTGYNSIEGFVLENCSNGILTFSNVDMIHNVLTSSRNNKILNNTFLNCGVGIFLSNSGSNVIDNNTINDNDYGIYIWSDYNFESNNNTLTKNMMIGNNRSFIIEGDSVSDFDNMIGTSNLVDGKPFYYIKNSENVIYDSSINAGEFYCISCIDVLIKDIRINDGIFFIYTTNSRIQNVTCSNNAYIGAEPQRYNGISLFNSDNNTIIGNNASNNGYGISLFESKNNTLSDNNASNNSHGIILRLGSNDNIINGNNVFNNENGIFIVESYRNTLNGNTASSNFGNGITLSSTVYNVLTGNNVSNNHNGISLIYYSRDNTIYNNFFNNSNNFDFMVDGNIINSWNTSKISGTNIINGQYLGGNVWATPDSTGFSQNCLDNNNDSICDSEYILNENNIDYLPLSYKSDIPDTVPPTLSFTAQTPINQSILDKKWVFVSIIANKRLKTALLEWNGINGSMSGSGNIWQGRKISLENGTYKFRVWGSDDFGNWNSTESREITILASSTDRIVKGGSGVGEVGIGPMTWTASNFLAFWHEDGLSSEVLNIFQSDLNGSQRVIDTDYITYSTDKRNIITYMVYSETGLTVNNGLDLTGFRATNGGYYAKVGWLGKPYVAVNGQTYKLSEIVLEQNSTDFKDINLNETWNLGNGYNLTLFALDKSVPPWQAAFNLSNESGTISQDFFKEGDVYTYLNRNLAGESDATFFVTYIDNISENSVRLKYTWLISDNVTIFNAGDRFGIMEVRSANTNYFILSNENPITLSRGSDINLLDDFYLHVNDNQSLEYYPVMRAQYQYPPSSLSIIINNGSAYTNSTSVTLNLSALNADEMSFSNDSISWSPWEAFATSKLWEISSGEGIKTIYFKARNTIGETAPVNGTIILDITPPIVNIISPLNGTVVNTEKVMFTGNVSDNYGITTECIEHLSGMGGGMGCGGPINKTYFEFNRNITLQEGNNLIRFIYIDVAQNIGIVSVNVTRIISPQLLNWKFISVPYELENSTVAHVLQGIEYESLNTWDPIERKWVSPVTNFKPLQGYLIKMNTSQTITNLEKKTGVYMPPSIDLVHGWNLVGTYGTNPLSAEMVLQSIDDSYDSIWNFNVSTRSYDKVGVNGKSGYIDATHVGTDIFMMQPNESYWVFATANTSLRP
jgi:nitrous oxidase accessory protein